MAKQDNPVAAGNKKKRRQIAKPQTQIFADEVVRRLFHSAGIHGIENVLIRHLHNFIFEFVKSELRAVIRHSNNKAKTLTVELYKASIDEPVIGF